MSSTPAVTLYTRLLDAWNRRDAAGFAACFTDDALAIGFDGSRMDGREAIAREIADVFASHETSAYVAHVRGLRDVGADVTLLDAAVGMVPPGAHEIKPDVNALQTVLVRAGAIALLQSTPAAFHGRPHLRDELTAEVTRVLRSGAVVGGA